jgi:menaquinone-9 beta-reductase
VSLISIAGGGPAGASAAIAALLSGSEVDIIERSRTPRHKVCGEFLSPEIHPLLESLGVAAEFADLRPARVSRMAVHVGRREKVSRLPEPAFGLSRFAFDDLLLRRSQRLGARMHATGFSPHIVATGRASTLPRGERFFGFKAHFDGPCDDAVELYFFDGCYIGINCVEGSRTNVCGLGPEPLLHSRRFDIDGLLRTSGALAARIDPLARSMDWMFTGPLEFGNRLRTETGRAFYAGDALSFVDPFTGSGLVSAVVTGSLAGDHAARGLTVETYLAACRRVLSRPFEISSALRWIARTQWAERLLESIPGQLLYWATRPRVGLVRR